MGLFFASPKVAFLKLYTQYCSNESIGLKRLMETKRANPALEEFLEAFKQEEQSEKLNLESFLIKPLQRLTKYPLLLKVEELLVAIVPQLLMISQIDADGKYLTGSPRL